MPGLRLGELLALSWDDVDLVAGRLVVSRNLSRGEITTPKNGRTREIPLGDDVLAALKRHRYLRGEVVFCQPDGRMLTKGETKHALGARFRKAGHVLETHVSDVLPTASVRSEGSIAASMTHLHSSARGHRDRVRPDVPVLRSGSRSSDRLVSVNSPLAFSVAYIAAPSLALVLALVPACSSSDASAAPPGGDASAGSDSGASSDDAAATDSGSGARDGANSSDASAIIAARPYTLKVPAAYDASKPTPLLVMFHGYGASGAIEESYFRIADVVDAHGFLYAYGDGTVDSKGKRFWNATDACCNLDGKNVDDVAYAGAIMDDVASKYNVDPKRIFVIGHSNGGFMVHRLACDLSPRIAAIVSLAGAVWNDPARCNPTSPVSILDVHGDADQTISYDGGGNPPYPSEATTMATWAQKNACTGALTANGKTLDLDTSIAGAETVEKAYGGCPAGIDVELWTIQGGAHVPALATPTWAEEVWGFLSAHPKI